ncbi:ABC transporter permease [Streptomyces sp. AK02-04a]|uniref:ABC transporter permease n=1 Tax=Streptomyces sp. AK02-04a TaxID=3028649 RepID=UPI0029BB2BD7|nr:FtsX-like permease family protein [Streptomyces sp. AK02-04a]MDX3762417.1 FtsX-like permease family protein [Streptomyces sp. AK02-04a]
MSALGKVVRAGVGRRRTQTLVMVLTTTMAVAAAVLATGLLVASHAPFEHAFAKQRGAQLTAWFDPAGATAAQVAATAHISGVTATAGPYPVLSLSPRFGANKSRLPVGGVMTEMSVVGRADTGGAVDDLVLTAGHWATGSGQIVLSDQNMPLGVGDQLSLPDLPGKPVLTVVGLARSVTATGDAWVSPTQIAALTVRGSRPGLQMLYRFRSAATDADVTADRKAVETAVPPGSLTGASSYLQTERSADRTEATFVPFVVAFGVLGLVMSVLVIGTVVSGAVGSATRRIGILKALGLTPAEVARAYVAQALIPATVGTALGLVLGNLMAIPALHEAQRAYSTGSLAVAPWIDLAVPAAALAAVAATALAPALRAGRLRTVEALTVGRTPRAGRGRTVQRLLAGLPLPRALSLGLAMPFARPARSATVAAAVVFGTLGVTFGTGLAISVNGIQNGLDRRDAGAVTVQDIAPLAGNGSKDTVDPALIAAKIAAQPGTWRYFSTEQAQVRVAGLAGSTNVIAYRSHGDDDSWGAYQLVSGTWFHGPGQAVVPYGFLRATGTRVGDTVTLTAGGHRAAVRIVGEDLDVREGGMVMLTDSSSLAGLHLKIPSELVQFDIDLEPGTDATAYAASLGKALQPPGILVLPSGNRVSPTIIAMDALVAMFTLMLVAVAGLGVLNTVVLDTRERVHDFGVLKALGMSPRQTVAMVVTSVAGIGLVAGAVGVPIGVALHRRVLPMMGRAAGTAIPKTDMAVYSLTVLVALVLGGLVIATAGALLPAGWAAKARTAGALRSE